MTNTVPLLGEIRRFMDLAAFDSMYTQAYKRLQEKAQLFDKHIS